MIKKHYKKELILKSTVRQGARGNQVKKIQEWLNLWRYVEPRWTNIVTIDGDFGPQTKSAVNAFQTLKRLPATGIVNTATYQVLTSPLANAYKLKTGRDIRKLIVHYSEQHLKNIPRELNNNNEGPWVRSYMDGNEGSPWAWCMGFVQAVLDMAFSTVGQRFTDYVPHTYSCDVVGFHGQNNQSLIRNRLLRQGHVDAVQPGDLFLVVKNPRDWIHTGLIIDREGDWFHTIEGNTNDEGVREGFEVCSRMRNFRRKNIDVFSLKV